jgi:hypothetical protein
MRRNFLAGMVLGGTFLLCWGISRAQQAPAVSPLPPSADVMFVRVEQGSGPEFGPMGGPIGERIEMLGFEGMHPGKVVTGAPFSATATSESVQTLADGSHITRKTQTVLSRDGQGRFRKETTVQGFGPLAASGQAKTFVIIHDAVAGTIFALDPGKKIAHQLPNLRGHGSAAAGGELKDKFQYKKIGGADNVQTEDLGKQTINGISAQGTRHTRTIPAGQIGNEKALTIVLESWYSPDLQLVVMSKRSDPRFGETTYTVSNIQQKEPDAALFSVPADYTIEQGGPGHDIGGIGMPHHTEHAPQPPPAG